MFCSWFSGIDVPAAVVCSMCSSSLELVNKAVHPVSTRGSRLTGSAPRSALRAEPPENEFAFAQNSLTQGTRGRPGHVVPLHVLDIAAAVADEVVMPHALRIEPR